MDMEMMFRRRGVSVNPPARPELGRGESPADVERGLGREFRQVILLGTGTRAKRSAAFCGTHSAFVAVTAANAKLQVDAVRVRSLLPEPFDGLGLPPSEGVQSREFE